MFKFSPFLRYLVPPGPKRDKMSRILRTTSAFLDPEGAYSKKYIEQQNAQNKPVRTEDVAHGPEKPKAPTRRRQKKAPKAKATKAPEPKNRPK